MMSLDFVSISHLVLVLHEQMSVLPKCLIVENISVTSQSGRPESPRKKRLCCHSFI